MINSSKYEYIIPGYTGYIPHYQPNKGRRVPERVKNGHIPGYYGFVPKIYSENLHGKTYG